MQIYNSLSGKKETLTKPRGGKPLRFFVCGPTVYDSPHIGHARTNLAFDIIVRSLRFYGFNVLYAQNITNVDDKIIARARERKIDPFKLAEQYESEYLCAMRALGVNSVDVFARASNFIPNIISQVNALMKKGYAYEINDDGIYFDIKKFKNYGKLSHRTVLEAEDSVSRIDENINKRNKGDFCLWKFVKVDDSVINQPKNKKDYFLIDGEPAWKSDFGFGRPGWHIEDTAITENLFGTQYDIHGGGVDLKFPHHEAEIAQQESASGKTPFVRFWMHSGILLVDGKKMSKSLNNFILLSDFLSGDPETAFFKGQVLRMLVCSSHYRSPINFTQDLYTQAAKTYSAVYEFWAKLVFVSKKQKQLSEKHPDFNLSVKEMEERWNAAMNDDFNTSEAMGAVFSFMNKYQASLWGIGSDNARVARKKIEELFSSIGFSFLDNKVPSLVRALLKKRELSRFNKQFMQADDLRKQISKLGYEVDDTPFGQYVRKIFSF